MAIATLDPLPSGPHQATAQAGRWLALPVLLYLATILVPVGFHLGPLNMNGQRLLLLVLVVPLTVRLLAGHYGRVLWTDILFLLYILWVMVAMAVNNPDRALVFFGSQAVEFIGGYVLGRACIRTREDFIALCKAVVALVCLTLPFALVETAIGRAPILHAVQSLPGVRSASGLDVSLRMGQRMGVYRVQGIFQHPILYGLFCALIFPLAFTALKGLVAPVTRYLLSAAVGLCAFLSLSAGPLLAMVLVGILIGWAWALQRVAARWWWLLALFVAGYVVVDLLSNRTPIRVFLTYATFSPHTAFNRLITFEWGMVNVRANPIFGIGLNDWVRPAWMRSGSMDNFWLVNAVRYGIPGFALLATGYLIALWRIGRRDFDADPVLWQLRRGWMIAFVGLTFTLATVHIWHALYSFVFFLFGAGMWMLTATPADGTAARPGPDADSDGMGLRRSPQPDAPRSPEAMRRAPATNPAPFARTHEPATRSDPALPYTRFGPTGTGNRAPPAGYTRRGD